MEAQRRQNLPYQQFISGDEVKQSSRARKESPMDKQQEELQRLKQKRNSLRSSQELKLDAKTFQRVVLRREQLVRQAEEDGQYSEKWPEYVEELVQNINENLNCKIEVRKESGCEVEAKMLLEQQKEGYEKELLALKLPMDASDLQSRLKSLKQGALTRLYEHPSFTPDLYRDFDLFLSHENEKISSKNSQECRDFALDLVNLLFQELDAQLPLENQQNPTSFGDISQAVAEAKHFYFSKVNSFPERESIFEQRKGAYLERVLSVLSDLHWQSQAQSSNSKKSSNSSSNRQNFELRGSDEVERLRVELGRQQREMQVERSELEKNNELLRQQVGHLEQKLQVVQRQEAVLKEQMEKLRVEKGELLREREHQFSREVGQLKEKLEVERERVCELEKELEIGEIKMQEELGKRQMGEEKAVKKLEEVSRELERVRRGAKRDSEGYVGREELREKQEQIQDMQQQLTHLKSQLSSSTEALKSREHEFRKELAIQQQKQEFLEVQVQQYKDLLEESQRYQDQIVTAMKGSSTPSTQKKREHFQAFNRIEDLEEEVERLKEEKQKAALEFRHQLDQREDKLNEIEGLMHSKQAEGEKRISELWEQMQSLESQKESLSAKLKSLERKSKQREEELSRDKDRQLGKVEESLEEQKALHEQEVRAIQAKCEDSLKQLREFYEQEKERLELAVEGERAKRRQQEAEEGGWRAQEVESLQGQVREMEAAFEQVKAEMEEQQARKQLRIEELERQLRDRQEYLQGMESGRTMTFEKQMQLFEQHRLEYQRNEEKLRERERSWMEKAETLQEEKAQKEKQLAILEHKYSQLSSEMSRRKDDFAHSQESDRRCWDFELKKLRQEVASKDQQIALKEKEVASFEQKVESLTCKYEALNSFIYETSIEIRCAKCLALFYSKDFEDHVQNCAEKGEFVLDEFIKLKEKNRKMLLKTTSALEEQQNEFQMYASKVEQSQHAFNSYQIQIQAQNSDGKVFSYSVDRSLTQIIGIAKILKSREKENSVGKGAEQMLEVIFGAYGSTDKSISGPINVSQVQINVQKISIQHFLNEVLREAKVMEMREMKAFFEISKLHTLSSEWQENPTPRPSDIQDRLQHCYQESLRVKERSDGNYGGQIDYRELQRQLGIQ